VAANRQYRKGTWGQFMLTLMTLMHLRFCSREWCQSIMGWSLTWPSSWSQKIHTVWCHNGPRDGHSPRWAQGSSSRFSWRRSSTLSMIVSSRSSSHSATETHLWCMELVSLRTNRSSLVKKWRISPGLRLTIVMTAEVSMASNLLPEMGLLLQRLQAMTSLTLQKNPFTFPKTSAFWDVYALAKSRQ
jgi:hypothetical protein